MKFRTERRRLLQLLQTVSKAVAVRTPKQVLSGILFEAHETSVLATAYDMELGIKEFLQTQDNAEFEVLREGQIVIPAKHFMEIVRKLSGEDVTIEVMSNGSVAVRSENVECYFHGMDASEFPRLPVVTSEQCISVPSQILKEMIKSTAFAASTIETRPILTGIHVEIKDGELSFAATDSLRLANRRIRLEDAHYDSFSAIIPAKSLVELAHILPDADFPVSISIMPSHCMFKVGTLEFFTRIIDGTYVDISRLIPKSQTTEVVINTDEMIRTMERASVFAPSSQEVQLTIGTTSVVITTQSPDVGNITDSVRALSIDGTEMRIAFSAKNVLDALRTCSNESTVLRFNGSHLPFVILPEGQIGLIHVISPIITRNQLV